MTAAGRDDHAAAAGRDERHATWLELFFDLVAAAAVAKLAAALLEHPGARGLGAYLLLFVPVWWTWLNFSYLASQFDRGTRRTQVILLVAMFGSLLFAGTIGDGLHGHPVALPLAYVALRLLLVGAYLWRGLKDPDAKSLCLRYVGGFSLGIAVWLASLAVPERQRWTIWAAALVVEIATPVVAHLTARLVPAHVSHMPERFGQFTLIVLGETVLGVSGESGVPGSIREVLVIAAGFGLAVAFWWSYFRRAEPGVISEALEGSRRDLLLSYVYGYAHCGVFAALPLTGIGVVLASHEPDGRRAAVFALLGAAGFLAAGVVADLATPRSLPRAAAVARLLAAVVLPAFALVRMPAAAVLVIAAAVVAAVSAVGERDDATLDRPISAVRWRQPLE